MRGFRGSRAAQNVMAFRTGHLAQGATKAVSSYGQEQPSSAKPVLPDWLKTPETLARERLERREPAQPPRLRLIEGGAAPKPRKAVKKPTAKKRAPTVRRKAA